MLNAVLDCSARWAQFSVDGWRYRSLRQEAELTEQLFSPLRSMIEVATTPDHAERFGSTVAQRLAELRAWESLHPLREKQLSEHTREIRRKGYRGVTTLTSGEHGISATGTGGSPTPRAMSDAASELSLLLFEWTNRLATPAERVALGIADHARNTQSVATLPPDIAEQMLDDVMVCAKGKAAKRGERRNAGGDRGGTTPPALPVGTTDAATPSDPTMRDLADEAGISDDTFRRVRNAARIEVGLKGGAARNRRYTTGEVDRLIEAALAGNYIERTAMAGKWAKWGRK